MWFYGNLNLESLLEILRQSYPLTGSLVLLWPSTHFVKLLHIKTLELFVIAYQQSVALPDFQPSFDCVFSIALFAELVGADGSIHILQQANITLQTWSYSQIVCIPGRYTIVVGDWI